jgi:hypothetical protein
MPDKPKPLKQPFYITRRDGLPLTFAGLWERWKDGTLSCTILTCEALDKTGHPDKPDSPSTGSIAAHCALLLDKVVNATTQPIGTV